MDLGPERRPEARGRAKRAIRAQGAGRRAQARPVRSHRNIYSGGWVQPSRTHSEWVVAWLDAPSPWPTPSRSIDESQPPRRLAAPRAAEPTAAAADASKEPDGRRGQQQPPQPLDAVGRRRGDHPRVHHHLLERPARLEHQPHEAELQRAASPGEARQRQVDHLQHRQRRHHGRVEEPGPGQHRVLHLRAVAELRRCHAGAAAPAQRDARLHEVGLERVGPAAVVRAPDTADHRALRLDESKGPGRHGRGDEHRAQPGEGVHDREAEDHVRRRRRLRPGEGRDQRGRRLPEAAGQVP